MHTCHSSSYHPVSTRTPCTPLSLLLAAALPVWVATANFSLPLANFLLLCNSNRTFFEPFFEVVFFSASTVRFTRNCFLVEGLLWFSFQTGLLTCYHSNYILLAENNTDAALWPHRGRLRSRFSTVYSKRATRSISIRSQEIISHFLIAFMEIWSSGCRHRSSAHSLFGGFECSACILRTDCLSFLKWLQCSH